MTIVFAVFLSGCSIDVSTSDAVIWRATPLEVAHDAYASHANPSGKGLWALLEATMSRETVQRISRWEVYPHVRIVDCARGTTTNFGSEPRMGGVDLANTNAVATFLRLHPMQQRFRVTSLTFARPGDFSSPQCLTFDGGNYLGQKIIGHPVPIRGVQSIS